MMYWKPTLLSIAGLAITASPILAQAKIYVSIEQAQQLLFPNQSLVKHPIIISKALRERMRQALSLIHI